MYTATHMVLFNSLVRRLNCPHQTRDAGLRVRSLCSSILTEAESLHHLLEISDNTQHCITDLWLEQSKSGNLSFSFNFLFLVGFCLGLGSDQRCLRPDWLETLVSLTSRHQPCIIR